MAFDRTKPYRARDGRKAEIVATLKNDRLLVVYDDGEDYTCVYANGRKYDGSVAGYDLVNIPEKRVVVINHYPDGIDSPYTSQDLADKFSAPGRLGCTVLEYERPVFYGE